MWLSFAFVMKGFLELMMAFLLAHGVMWVFLLLLDPQVRNNNLVYSIFQLVTRPIFQVAEKLAPKIIASSHMGLYAFGLLFSCWFLILVFLPEICASYGLAVSECKLNK